MKATTEVLAAMLVGGGSALVITGLLLRVQRRQQSLLELFDLDGGEAEVPVEVVTESPEAPALSRVTQRAGELIGRLDNRGSVTRALARADLPLRAGEYLFLVAVAGVLLGCCAGFIVGSPVSGVAMLSVVLGVAWLYPRRCAAKRKDRLRNQLPDAFSLIASSVASGHTFLRSIQLLSEQIPQPLADELNLVVAEVSLGSNLIDALDNLALRSDITELRWAVKAVRIQQTTGGQLAEILHTLADFMRAREEVHREVKVLSAEGRFSGYVLEALPVFVLAVLLVMRPTYLAPLTHGVGLLIMIMAFLMMITGHFIVRKIVRIEV